MGLTTQEQILIEQRVANEAKSTLLAYVIWFFVTGLFGIHRLYLGRKTSGLIMLCIGLLGIIMAPAGGHVILVASFIWWLVDAFLIPGMVKVQKDEMRRRLTADAQISSVAQIPVDTSKWSKEDRDKFMAQRIGR
jgi:TM2 domain-containing membrane protein YozV